MTDLGWNTTASQHWSEARQIWQIDIENPLRDWCESTNIGCILNWTSPITKLIRGDVKQYVIFYTIESLSTEIIDDIQNLLKAINARALIFTNTKIVKDNLWPNLEVIFLPELYGAFYLQTHDHHHSDERLFCCLMRRADTVRQSWFYELHARGLLDQGFVSYLSINPEWKDPDDHAAGFDHIHQSWNMGDNECYQTAWSELRSKLPYQNFNEDRDLASCHDRCKYSVILSTHNDCDDAHWFNEKEARALQSASIVIPSLHPTTVSFLSDIGLQLTFDQTPYCDWPWWRRRDKVLEILATDSLQIDWHLRIAARENNRKLFKKWNHAICAHELVGKIIEISREKFM